MWDRHFTNVSVEIGVQPLNVYGFLGLLGDLGGILAPPSQIPGLNLTQFNEIGSFRSIY